MASANANEWSLADKAADLKLLENILQAATALMVHEVKHENVAIFLGATKSGKSSLINYLIGNKLIGKKHALCRPFSIEKADNSDGPQIGRGAASETIIPTRCENPVKLPGLVIWDAPGFEDNREAVQDITNAFYSYELFKNIKSAKIVLVTDVIDIVRDQIYSFLLILESVENFLKYSMRSCFPSIIVVFTKVLDVINDCQVDKAFIQDLLRHQVLSSASLNISDVGKDIVRHLIDNTQNIGFFKQATSGSITDAIDGGVIQAIQSARPVDHSILREVIFPSIAPSSKVFLFESREQLSSMGAFSELQSSINNVFTDRLNHYSRIQEDEPSRQKLLFVVDELGCLREKIGKGLQPNVNFYGKIDIMQTIDSRIEN